MSRRHEIDPLWWRRFYVAWLAFAAVYGSIQATNTLMELARLRVDVPLWLPFVCEYTGVYALVMLLPVIRWFDGLYPIRRDSWHYAVPAHLLMTVPFALVHSALFVAARKVIFPVFDATYTFGDLGFELVYEYRKIALGYGLALFSLYAFRHYVQLHRLLEMPEAAAEPSVPRPVQRFLARRGNRDVIVNAGDIRYVEAAGNYVVLHTAEGALRLRETISNMTLKLAPADFARIHRSHIVNLDAIKEIQPWFHGDQRLVLHDGTMLNLSRRYRDELTSRTSVAATAGT